VEARLVILPPDEMEIRPGGEMRGAVQKITVDRWKAAYVDSMGKLERDERVDGSLDGLMV
jgi:hypothetical protein